MGDDTYGFRWRLKTAAIALGLLVLTPVAYAWTEMPGMVAAVLVPGVLLLASAIVPHWTLPWRRGQRRGAWQVAGAFFVPAIFAVFGADLLRVFVQDEGWADEWWMIVVGLLPVVVAAVLALVYARLGIRSLDDAQPEGDS